MIMNKILGAALALAIGACALSSCDHSKGWSISGEVAGAGEQTLTVEGFNNGIWYVVDSVKTRDGEFKYSSPEPAPYPEIMRLGFKGQYIYFPVDSVDRLSVMADTAAFATDYRLDGSLQARSLRQIDSVINASVAERGVLLTVADSDLKHKLFTRAFDDPSVVSVYYLINRTVGDRPLYDIANSADLRLYGAVAQRFINERPDDPRTAYLSAIYKRGRAALNPGKGVQMEAQEVSMIDIVRSDENGKKHSLKDLATKGGVTVVSFTAYNLEGSPAYNVLLNKVYEKYRGNGLQIYQLAFDGDETSWRQTARNLPWITVWNSTTDDSQPLIDYNVGALPMTFIIDRQGTIAARVTDPAQLEKELAKYM